ncbi:MAG: glucose-6-phosphate dehydrogenase [Spirochaetes bacterium]|nr:glucose-6-phosphate dehydrogenase [Spirochaetota bacterium]
MKKPDPNCLVIFGASGDLTKRKLVPALFTLYIAGLLPDNFSILGISRTQLTDEEFRQNMHSALEEFSERKPLDTKKIVSFTHHLYYLAINTMNSAEYGKVAERLKEIEEKEKTHHNYVFYLATPPKLYQVIPGALAKHNLNKETEGWRRIVVEKPFGTDAESAHKLNKYLLKYYQEHQIYRIDHYLGKETVQNLLVFRFSNAIFEPLWNRSYVDYVEVTSSENIGVEGRGGYYDASGAVCDMLQNHLLQLVALIAMEPPAAIDADSVRNEVVKVLQCLRPLSREKLTKNMVLGQYTDAVVDKKKVPAYRDEEGVPDNSRTETYVALKVHIDNWRWNGVPFYIRTGKRLPIRLTEVVIHFKQTPHPVFGVNPPDNKLVIRIQPNEGILIKFGLKEPGAGFNSKVAKMEFHYADMAHEYILTAYERLLLDCMLGDATLYSRADTVETCWKFVQPILEYRTDTGNLYQPPGNLYGYPAQSWGPVQAVEMLQRDKRAWRNPHSDTPEGYDNI